MKGVSIFLIATFAILIVVFVVLTVKKKSTNQVRQDANIIIPFAGYLSPPNANVQRTKNNVGSLMPTQEGLFLVGMGDGESASYPQIQCPVGSTINIIGAYIETNDPFGECSGKPDPVFSLSCGNSNVKLGNLQVCGADSPCPTGMTCNTAKACVPSTCTTHCDCTSKTSNIPACSPVVGSSCSNDGDVNSSDPTLVCRNGTWTLDPAFGQCMMCDLSMGPGNGMGVCKNIPLCTNVTTSSASLPANRVCTDPTKRCKVRDASAHLAGVCDGKSVCLQDNTEDNVWKPNVPGGQFGPLPCDISATLTDPDYQNLPIVPGWNAGNAPAGSGGNAQHASFSQGYYVHGIYTCIPDSERIVTSSDPTTKKPTAT